ncbi:MAG: nuclear transport factor 2 family protein, partial [Candidatus Aminicenantes bacterium]
MKKLLMIVSLIFLLCLAFGCQQQGEETVVESVANVETDIAADKEAIIALLNNNASVISAEDLDGWLSLFTDDAIFMNPNAESLKGVEASRMYATPVFEQFDHEIEITVDEVEVSSYWAFARWSFTWEFTPKDGGDTTLEKGKE